MPADIKDLEPTHLFGHFASILKIPRESKNEGAAREFVLSWAREKGYRSSTDDVGNVVVYVPATKGNESASPVVLQGHLDMVCEKTSDSGHDFDKDPIPTYIDGDLIRAKGTTLGADNGIGLAASMAAADDPGCVHGPLELLFTIDEETGLTGAFGFDPTLIEGRTMLNLDSEEEGTLYVGCAGGGDTKISLDVTGAAAPDGYEQLTVKVSGLKGGHSGLDIGAGRGNAIKVLARAIEAGTGSDGFRFGCIDAGNKRNAIPRDASACLFLPVAETDGFVKRVEAFADVIKTELGSADPGVTVKAEKSNCDCEAMGPVETSALLRMLLAIPHGITAMSHEIQGQIETSTNLAVARRDRDQVNVLCNTRSSVDSALESIRLAIRSAGELAGASVEHGGKYPGWRPDMDSPVLALCRKAWSEMTGEEPLATTIHAGLECGIIGEKAKGMDSISFGPTIQGAHSPDENVSIGSTARFYDFLKLVLDQLARS